MPKAPLSAVILAGGKSSRMGENKALLRMGAKTMLEHAALLAGSLFEETFIIVRPGFKLPALDLAGALIREDFVGGRGPLAGLYTGLCHSQTRAVCALSCDMPFLDEETLTFLVNSRHEEDEAVLFEDAEGREHPFPGIYARASRHWARLLLDHGGDSMRRFLQVVTSRSILIPADKMKSLYNMNTREDYEEVLSEGCAGASR